MNRQLANIALVGCALLAATAGCGGGDPFAYVKVSGRVTYDDGSPIPAKVIRLTFLPQAAARDPKTHPLAGNALVTSADGAFSAATSHLPEDGLVRGKHKVLVVAYDDQDRPTDAVPSEYSDAAKTPLEVDTAEQPFALKIKRKAGP